MVTINQENLESSHRKYLSRSYLPELDGLRALSILIVISVHMKDRVWEWLAGRLGVTVFFVLSGYLITMLALREEKARGALNLRAFFIRRSFRLLPLYYVVLAGYCALIFGLGWAPEKRRMLALALPYYLFYFQEWPFFNGINQVHYNIPFYQAWSLGIEEKFYLIWPFLGFAAWRGTGVTRRVGTTILVGLTMFAPLLVGDSIGIFLYPYSHILMGCLTALLLDSKAWFNRLEWLGRPLVGRVFVAAFLLIHFSTPYFADEWQEVVHNVYTFATAIFLITLLLGDGPIQRFLRIPFLVTIGKLSYGMYLIHLLALNVAEKLASPGSGNILISSSALLLACAFSILLAYVLAVTIERPGMAIGRRLSTHLFQMGLSPRSDRESLAVSTR